MDQPTDPRSARRPPFGGGSSPFPDGLGPGERRVVDRLPDSFALLRSESEWLLTLLSADELRYIFEGPDHGEAEG